MPAAPKSRLNFLFESFLQFVVGAVTFGVIGLVSGGWDVVPLTAVTGGILAVPAVFAMRAAQRSRAASARAKEDWLRKRAEEHRDGDEV
jgi:hypothetical protein